jgi:DNA-binding transcriptional LysR family regulator
MPTLKQLTHAHALGQTRSFRVAAQQLHLSQPALTRSIQALEDTLGVVLFDRRSDGVEPTAFGELLLERARAVLLAQDDLLRDLRLMAGLDQGTLRVAAGLFPSDVLIPEVAAVLAKTYPNLNWRLRQGSWDEVADQVLTRTADLGVAEISEASLDSRLVTEPLAPHAVYFFCRAGHPLCKGAAISLSDIAEFPWVSSRLPARLLEQLPRAKQRAGTVDPASGFFVPAWEVEAIATEKRIVAASDVVGCALLSQLRAELEAGILDVVPARFQWMQLGYGLIHLRNRSLSPAAIAFMDECRRQDALLAAREAALVARYLPPLGGTASKRRQRSRLSR